MQNYRKKLKNSVSPIRGEISPDNPPEVWDLSEGSDRQINWHCGVCSHEWRQSAKNRFINHSGCPICAKNNRYKTRSIQKNLALLSVLFDTESINQIEKIVKRHLHSEMPETIDSECIFMNKLEFTCPNFSCEQKICVKAVDFFTGAAVCKKCKTSPFRQASLNIFEKGFHKTNHLYPLNFYRKDGNRNTPIEFLCEQGHLTSFSYTSYYKNAHCTVCITEKHIKCFSKTPMTPRMIKDYSSKNEIPLTQTKDYNKYWWTCRICGHETQQRKIQRYTAGCLACAHKVPSAEYNLQLALKDKEIIFDDKLNKTQAKAMMPASRETAHFICLKKNHKLEITLSDLARRNYTCPDCSRENKASQQQQKWSKEITQALNPTVCTISNCTLLELNVKTMTHKAIEVDMLITNALNNLNIVIEYDGKYWHENQETVERDIAKTQAMLEAGYIVIRLREENLDYLPIPQHPHFYQYTVAPKGIDQATVILVKAVLNKYNCLQNNNALF